MARYFIKRRKFIKIRVQGVSPFPAILATKRNQNRTLATKNSNRKEWYLVPKYKLGKTARLVLRLKPDQKILIVNKARNANKTINDFCTDIILNFEYVDQLQRIENMQRKKLALLQNLANNINQIAVYCNTHETFPQKHILQQILKEAIKDGNF